MIEEVRDSGPYKSRSESSREMKPGRMQYTLGSLMILIAIVAVFFAYFELVGGLLVFLGGLVPGILLMALVYVPCLLFRDSVERWVASSDPTLPPDDRQP